MKVQSGKALEAEMRVVARGEIAAPSDAKLPSVEPAPRSRMHDHLSRRGEQ